MSMTDQNRIANADVDLTSRSGSIRQRVLRETKPSPKTSEMWFAIVGVAILAVIYNTATDASLNLFRTCLLATILGAAYIVSRGFAKSGSHDDYDQDQDQDYTRSR